MTRRVADEPLPKERHRSGETDGEFRRLARKLARRFDVRKQFGKTAKARARRRRRTIVLSPEEWGAPDAHLTSSLDWLALCNNDSAAGSDYGGEFETNRNPISPHM